jgi:CubicO group peptidase (beta-lactamase class C family)
MNCYRAGESNVLSGMRLFLVAILSTCFSVTAFPQRDATEATIVNLELKQRLDQKVPLWLKAYEVPSAAVAFIEHGKLVWTAVYGQQTPGVPATDKTLYNVASLTKPISAEVILRLASDGKRSVDEPVYPYWTDWDVMDNPWSKLLTARLCLSHQTGFPTGGGRTRIKSSGLSGNPEPTQAIRAKVSVRGSLCRKQGRPII